MLALAIFIRSVFHFTKWSIKIGVVLLVEVEKQREVDDHDYML